ncbi:MAG: nucleotide exchange factor GrpE [Oscillospiraceae bacterium]|nr:nucleotide exchange factor GrpE [Oscillospiraceae bacterium]
MMNEEEIEKTEDIPEEQAEQETQTEQPEETEANEADKVAEELSAVKEQLVRTMAEYDNFRKRSQREKDALRSDIIVNVTSKFLPVMDNLERALNADCTDENYKSGVKMIYDSFMETLKGLGVEEIESDGADFSPNLHQAVQKIQSEEVESGKVAQTFAKGYKIGDKVIRFAVVAVAE